MFLNFMPGAWLSNGNYGFRKWLESMLGFNLHPVFSVISIPVFQNMFPVSFTYLCIHACMHVSFLFFKNMFAYIPVYLWKHTCMCACVQSEGNYPRCIKYTKTGRICYLFVSSIPASKQLAFFFCICWRTFWIGSKNGYIADEWSKLVITKQSTAWIVWLTSVLIPHSPQH